jgi:hypothetical protein
MSPQRPYATTDFETVYEIVNDDAVAHRGVIPQDRWKEPYMPREELRDEIEGCVRFWDIEDDFRDLIGA